MLVIRGNYFVQVTWLQAWLILCHTDGVGYWYIVQAGPFNMDGHPEVTQSVDVNQCIGLTILKAGHRGFKPETNS